MNENKEITNVELFQDFEEVEEIVTAVLVGTVSCCG